MFYCSNHAEAGANYVLLLGVPTSHYLVWWVRVKSYGLVIRVRDRSTVKASDSVRLSKLLRSLYSVRVMLGLGLQFDPNDVLTITSNVNLNLL